MKRALILDLDNTIYPVSSIAEKLFERLFALIDQNREGIDYSDLDKAKHELTRRPYQLVAAKYNFSPGLLNKGSQLLREITYDLPMQPFDGYKHIKAIPLEKFLVTAGFSKLQWSKVKMLGIEKDFAEIHIVDPEISGQTKKDIFAAIMERRWFKADELLVIGDDPESEIAVAAELGIETFLFDPESMHPDAMTTYRSEHLKHVLNYI